MLILGILTHTWSRGINYGCTYGSKIIEKHFTLDKGYSNFRDHKLSADPDEMSKLVKSVRELRLYRRVYKEFQRMKEKFKFMRRSLYKDN